MALANRFNEMTEYRFIAILVVAIITAKPLFSQSEYQPVLISISVDTSGNSSNINGRVTLFWSIVATTPDLTFEIQSTTRSFQIQNLPFTQRSWTDEAADAAKYVEGYQITSKIPGQDKTVWSAPHKTIFLHVFPETYDTCQQAITLRWTKYVGWQDGTTYQLWARGGKGNYEKLSHQPGDTFCIQHSMLPSTNYRYYVEATSTTGARSLSNAVEFKTYQPKSINNNILLIDSIVNNDNVVDLRCQTDTAADLHGYEWLRHSGNSEDSIKYQPGHSEKLIFLVGEPYILNSSFRVAAINLCDKIVAKSNMVYPIHLEAEQSDNLVNLSWNRSFETLDAESFNLITDVDNLGQKSFNYSGTSVSLNLDELGDEQSQQFCFQLISHAIDKISISNRVCMIRKPKIELPNAFTPNDDGKNDYFGPIIKNANIRSFRMIIFDQYGGRVFETNNSQGRWDGTCRGMKVMEGGYLYYIKFTTDYNQDFEFKGAINVVYP